MFQDIIGFMRNSQFWITLSIIAGTLGSADLAGFFQVNAEPLAAIAMALAVIFGFGASVAMNAEKKQAAVNAVKLEAALMTMGDAKADEFEARFS